MIAASTFLSRMLLCCAFLVAAFPATIRGQDAGRPSKNATSLLTRELEKGDFRRIADLADKLRHYCDEFVVKMPAKLSATAVGKRLIEGVQQLSWNTGKLSLCAKTMSRPSLQDLENEQRLFEKAALQVFRNTATMECDMLELFNQEGTWEQAGIFPRNAQHLRWSAIANSSHAIMEALPLWQRLASPTSSPK